MKSIGESITYYRKKKGLSQEKIAEYLGISRQAVTKWESDKSNPSTENLIRLAEIFEISLEELVSNGRNEEQSNPNCVNHTSQTKMIYKVKDELLETFIGKKVNDTSQTKMIYKIKDELLEQFIGKRCIIQLTDWNDGPDNAYIVSYDANFVYYVAENRKEKIFGAIGKQFIEEVTELRQKKTDALQKLDRQSFVNQKVCVNLDQKHIWSGFVGEETEYWNVMVENFDEKNLTIVKNISEIQISIDKITKIECNIKL